MLGPPLYRFTAAGVRDAEKLHFRWVTKEGVSFLKGPTSTSDTLPYEHVSSSFWGSDKSVLFKEQTRNTRTKKPCCRDTCDVGMDENTSRIERGWFPRN